MRIALFPVSLLAALSAASAFGQAQQQLKPIKPGWNLFSKEQDVQLGKESAAQVRQQMQIVKDPALNGFVQSIGKRLAAAKEADGFPYSFEVVNEPSINAFALPGGSTFVHTGLISAADNEAQIAGVLAHEIAHVALRHGTNQASKANLIQIPAMLAGQMAGGGMLGQLAQAGIGLGANSVLLKFSRNAESQADLVGARIMSQAGYNPVELARFFEKLEQPGKKDSKMSNVVALFTSDHPNPGNRIKAIQDDMKLYPKREYTANAGPDFLRIRDSAKALPPPQKAAAFRQEGNTPGAGGGGSMSPSSTFKPYQSREFNISYPENWQALGDQNSGMVVFAPQGAVSQNGAIGYGAIGSHFIPQDGAVDFKRETELLIRQLQSQNQDMKMTQAPQTATIDNRSAMITVFSNSSPFQGQSEVDVLVTIDRPDGLFYLLFIAPQNDFKAAEAPFQSMVKSIHIN